MKKHLTLFNISMVALMTIIILLNVTPLALIVTNSFKSDDDYNGAGIYLDKGSNSLGLPRKITFKSFADVLQVPGLVRAFLNTVILAGSVVLIMEVIGGITALVMAQYPIRITEHLVKYFIVSKSIPIAMTMISVFIITRALGWVDTYQGIIIAFSAQALPTSVFLFYNYFLGIPRELLDAAEVDGASFLQVFRHVVMPMSIGVSATVGILVFISAWASYLIGLTLLRTEEMYVLSIVVKNMTRWLEYNRPGYFAAFLLISLPTLLIANLFQRYISSGMLAGAIKE